MKNTAILLVQCPDRKGLDAAIADFIYRHDGNILHFEQHQAGEAPRLYLARVEWSLDGFQIDPTDFAGKFGGVAEKFSMEWRLELASHRPRVAIFVSKYDHCLVDLLYRQRNGEWLVRLPWLSAITPMPNGTRTSTLFPTTQFR